MTGWKTLAYDKPLDGQKVTVILARSTRRIGPKRLAQASELPSATYGQRGGHPAWFVEGSSVEATQSDQWRPKEAK